MQGKTALITGASRGIGLAIALRLAREGCNIVVAAKSETEDPRLGGTIHSAAAAVEQAGGKALALRCDIRDEARVAEVVEQAASHFGGLDIVVNNASAIFLAGTEGTPARRFDLMHDINVRGTFLLTQACIPHLRKSGGGHILTLSPPIDLNPRWLSPHPAYTVTKYAMSMMTLGWAAELATDGIAANSLWPATTIATAAVRNLLGGDYLAQRSRTPEIVADAAQFILTQDPAQYTGHLLTDEQALHQAGVTDFSGYAVDASQRLQPDLFL